MQRGKWRRVFAGILSAVMLATALPAAGAQTVSDVTQADTAWETFQNPPDYLKSRPLWFWNDEVSDMTVEKVQEIMERSYRESGYYGFGILPQWLSGYMSEEYMTLYRAALEKAKELGMKMCLYDENGFPSGSAGGILAKTYPEATAKRLDKTEQDVTGPQKVTMDIPEGTVLGAVVMDNKTKEITNISDTVSIHLADRAGRGIYSSSNHAPIAPNVYTVDQAFDGDYSTRWNSAGDAVSDQWIEVNYGEPTTVNRIVVREALDRIDEYALQYFDGNNWVDIASGNGIGSMKTWSFDAVTASRFRLFIKNLRADSGNSSSIYEMELFNGTEKIANPEMPIDYMTCAVPDGDYKLMVFTVVKDGYDRVDYLDSDCVDKFIEVTHEAYYKEFSEYFGTVIDSAFFDEPPLYQTEGGRMWTEKFNEKYEARYGYDPLTLYPALWYDIGENTTAARNALFGFRAELFATEYIKQMNDWCNAHGIKLTGHMDQEENVNPTSNCGDLMKVFKYQDMPGVDEITAYNRAQKAYKIVSSSANNWDKELVMTEIYGAMGEGMGVDTMYKDVMDEFAKGINYIVPHAVWYNNTRNIAAPPELSYRSAQYGPALPEYNNYIGRTQSLLQGGRHVADIGVLYPISTLNGGYYFDGSTNPFGTPYTGITPEEADYMEVGEYLSTTLRRDYTYLHPETLTERCTVEGDTLRLNNEINFEQYKVFVMPGCKIIDYDALLQIKKFYDQGGKVLATTQLPYLATDPALNSQVVSIIKEMFGVDPTPNEDTAHITYNASSTFRDMDAYAPKWAFDGVYGNGSRWNAGDQSAGNQWLEVDFGKEVTLNRTVITENVPHFRVNSYQIQYWDGSAWQTACTGTTIGDHHEDIFEPVTTSKLRLYVNTVVGNKDSVSIEEFEVYYNDSENLAIEKPKDDYAEHENANGGKAYFLGKQYQSHMEAVLDEFLGAYDVEIDPVTVAGDGNFSYIHKVKDNRDLYFFANSTSTEIDSYVNLRGKLTPSVWDPHTGTRYTPEYSYLEQDGVTVTRVKLNLAPVKSLFIVDEAEKPVFEVEAPESVTVGELFPVTVTTGSDVEKINLFNEYGLRMGARNMQISVNEQGQKVWRFDMSISTVGSGRTISVSTQKADGESTSQGSFTITVNPIQPVVYSSEIPAEVTAREDFTMKVVTNIGTDRVAVYNEYGLKMGIRDVSFVIQDDQKIWTFTMQIGTAGSGRQMTVKAANKYGAYSEGIQTEFVDV
ncbi:MAG: hypothetical protein HFE85_05530, partial [Clostridiales bacterium]|nr:hypothetical protein [Clostridiales bacterium]